MQKIWKESLNSDGEQFHQYQQSEQSSPILIYWTNKNTTTFGFYEIREFQSYLIKYFIRKDMFWHVLSFHSITDEAVCCDY